MALIKYAKSDRLAKEAVVLDMSDLGRQAERLLSAARADAARILEDARAEAQKLIDSADGRGHLEGLERGMNEGREIGQREGREAALANLGRELTELTRQWSAALQQWEADRREMSQNAREDVIRFAYAIGRKVVHRIVATDPSVVIDQVAAALAMVSRATSIEIAIHPDDRSLIEGILPQLVSAIAGCEHASLRDDPSVSRGGCVVRTANGRVDAGVETQLERIAEALVPDARQPGPEAPSKGGTGSAADDTDPTGQPASP